MSTGVVFNPLDLATEAARSLGWNANVILAQWRIETGNFTSPDFNADNNFAGIKYAGANTPGATKGEAASDGGYYAHYATPEAGAQGYINFVKANPRYANVASTTDPGEEAYLLQRDGWSTSSNYAQSLDNIMGVPYNANTQITTTGTNTGASAQVKVGAGDFIGQIDNTMTVTPLTAGSVFNFGEFLTHNAEAIGLRFFLVFLGVLLCIFAMIQMIENSKVVQGVGKVAPAAAALA